MCKQEESEPCDTEICKLEQKLQKDEREATVQEKKAKETIKEQLYAQLGKLGIFVTLYVYHTQCVFEFNYLSQMNHLGTLNILKA